MISRIVHPYGLMTMDSVERTGAALGYERGAAYHAAKKWHWPREGGNDGKVIVPVLLERMGLEYWIADPETGNNDDE